MKQWAGILIGTLVVATALALLFQALFWDQPVSPELAFLFVIVSFMLVVTGRAVWNKVVTLRLWAKTPRRERGQKDSGCGPSSKR